MNTAWPVSLGGTGGTSAATARTSLGVLSSTDQAFGQCRLSLSGGNLLLSRFDGKLLTISGQPETVPSAGVSLSPSGLTPSTLYYIYAYMNSGTMTLEASATGHSTDSTTGVEIKTGDATRSLVGMVYVGTGPAFNDSALKRHVVSWHNRGDVLSQGVLLTAVSIGPTTYTQVNSTALQQSLLLWTGQAVEVALTGAVAHDVAGVISTAATLDTNLVDLGAVLSVSTTNSPLGIGSTRSFDVGYEGLATFDLVGKVSSGTGSWLGSSSPDPARISLSCKAV